MEKKGNPQLELRTFATVSGTELKEYNTRISIDFTEKSCCIVFDNKDESGSTFIDIENIDAISIAKFILSELT